MNRQESGPLAIAAIVLLLAATAIGAAYSIFSERNREEPHVTERLVDPELQLMNQREVSVMSEQPPSSDVSIRPIEEQNPQLIDVAFSHAGDLFDVSKSGAKGEVMFGHDDEGFAVLATFEGLPDPATFGEGAYYEGWIVRRAPFHMISTGLLDVYEASVSMNIYGSRQDWSDHTYYVLTIEQNDGNPAPSTHVLSGILLEK